MTTLKMTTLKMTTLNDSLNNPPAQLKLSKQININKIEFSILYARDKMEKTFVSRVHTGWVNIIEPIKLDDNVYYKHSCFNINETPFKYSKKILFNIINNIKPEYEEFYTIINDTHIEKLYEYNNTQLIYFLKNKNITSSL